MKHVFYFLGLLPLIYEMSVIANPKRYFDFKNRIKKASKFDNMTTNQKAYSMFSLYYLLFAFIGLFSFNWFAFVVLIVISFIPKVHVAIMWIDSVISFLILLFILLNAYHFKIDTFAVVRSFF